MAAEDGLSVLGKMAELLIDPIQRQLGYLFCFNNNFQDLETLLQHLKAARNDEQDLRAARNDEQGREDAEKRKQNTLGQIVKLWIEKADAKIVEAERLISDKAELQKGCFSIKWCPNISLRFSLGRKGKKLSLVLMELLQSGAQLPHTGHALPMPPVDMRMGYYLPMPSINMRDYNGDALDFESRSQIMEDVIEMLRDKETMLIGICGMGGVGKTTFAKQVLQKVNDSHKHLFDIQVICTVSSSPNFNAIQQQVAEMLGSSLKGIDGEIARANHLRNAFSNKKVVVLLDDVWQQFDLKAKGFPLTKSDGVGCYCKIIYTSRHQNLWLGERTIIKKEIALELLTSEEAWNLFKRKVDLQDVDIDFHWKNEKGRKIVEGCGRLPLALGVVGGALIKKDKHEWENMLYQLRNHGQDQYTDKVNKVLETSYHFLKDRNAQFLFLLCCLFQKDEEIPIETLYRYAVSLQLFKDMNDLNCISDRVHILVDNLTRRNLLIKVKDLNNGELVVKMQNVVRDVGISIAKKEENDISILVCYGVQEHEFVVSRQTNMISILFKTNHIEVPDTMKLIVSKLELLRLESYASNTRILGTFFQGMDNLKVLDIVGGVISEFPYSSSFSYLAKLKMLSLEELTLDMASNISSIRHMKCLKTLSLRMSTIKTLPKEISELTNLRLLDLTRCQCLISNGILSRLTNLQELYMWDSFKDWGVLRNEEHLSTTDGDSNAAAGLIELGCLNKLWRLELEIANIEHMPRGIMLFSSSTLLEQFKISIGKGRKRNRWMTGVEFESGKRQLWLENAKGNINLFHELGVLIETGITNLYLCGDYGLWEKMHLHKFQLLKEIVLKRCGSLFPHSSSQIYDIEEINEQVGYWQRIEIYECDQMRHLCSTSTSRHLTNLQVLVLKKCEMMEEVVSICNETKQLMKIEFNALKTLKLCKLSRLERFCEGINEIHFNKLKTLELKRLEQFLFATKLELPCLEELSIKFCPNLETLCNIMAPSLKDLKIHGCDRLKYVFSSTSFIMKSISHLQYLHIEECKRLKGIIVVSMDAEDHLNKSVQFPNLWELHLESLNKLVSFVIDINNLDDEKEKPQNAPFYHDDIQLELPCLEELSIKSIPNLQTLCNIVAPSLKDLKINGCDRLRFVFSSTSFNLKSISHLQYLRIEGCKRLKGIVVELTGAEEQLNKSVQLPNLWELHLKSLDELTSFVIGVNNLGDQEKTSQNALFYSDEDDQLIVSFPCLRELTIDRLANISYIIGWKGRRRGLREEVDDYDKPIFPLLKDLSLSHLCNLIHIYESNHPSLGVLLFENLTSLRIDFCGDMRYLFSENIGRVAKNLEQLYIYNCPMMEVVMKNEATRYAEINFFPVLKKLEVGNLPALRSFCDVVYRWTLPSLFQLGVSECPNLKALSPGYLDTPTMSVFLYDNRRENADNWKDDINTTLKYLFAKKFPVESEQINDNCNETIKKSSNEVWATGKGIMYGMGAEGSSYLTNEASSSFQNSNKIAILENTIKELKEEKIQSNAKIAVLENTIKELKEEKIQSNDKIAVLENTIKELKEEKIQSNAKIAELEKVQADMKAQICKFMELL